jgi:hypothetical protein
MIVVNARFTSVVLVADNALAVAPGTSSPSLNN